MSDRTHILGLLVAALIVRPLLSRANSGEHPGTTKAVAAVLIGVIILIPVSLIFDLPI